MEGFEIHVLESLRPAWGQLGDILLEMQPSSWRFAGVAIEHGLRTLRELMQAREYVAITLPHRGRDDASAAVAGWDVCGVPPLRARADRASVLRSSKGGFNTSTRLEHADLVEYVRSALADPMLFGWFWEILLTPVARCEGWRP